MQSFQEMPDIAAFMSSVQLGCKTEDIFMALGKAMNEARDAVWPKGHYRKAAHGMRMVGVTYVTEDDQHGVGYFLEVEIELQNPYEYHVLSWILPVDPSIEKIVGHMKADTVKWTLID